MRKTGKLLITLLAVFCLVLPALPAKADNYTYTITISPGSQGAFEGVSGPIVYTKSYGEKVKIDFDKLPEITLNDEKYYPRGLRISGRDDSDNKVIRSETITVEEDVSYIVVYGIENNRYKYTVRYEDENGKKLHEPEEFYGAENDKPVVSFRYIENYLPNAYNETKTITKDESENVFVFSYIYVGPPETVTPTVTPPSTPTPTVTPRPTSTPTTVTPRPTSTPTTVTPRPTSSPTRTPVPTVAPTGTPSGTPAVTSTPAPPVVPGGGTDGEGDRKEKEQTDAADDADGSGTGTGTTGEDTPGAESITEEPLPAASASVFEPEELIDLDDDQVPLAGGGKTGAKETAEATRTVSPAPTPASGSRVRTTVIIIVIAGVCAAAILLFLRRRRQ